MESRYGHNDSFERDNLQSMENPRRNKSTLFKFWKTPMDRAHNDNLVLGADISQVNGHLLHYNHSGVSWDGGVNEDSSKNDADLSNNKSNVIDKLNSEFNYKPFTDRTILNEKKLEKMQTTEWNEHVLIFHPDVEHDSNTYRPDIDLDCGNDDDDDKLDENVLSQESFDLEETGNNNRNHSGHMYNRHVNNNKSVAPVNFNKSWEHDFELTMNDSSRDEYGVDADGPDDSDSILVDPSTSNDKILRDYWGQSNLIDELSVGTKSNLAKMIHFERQQIAQLRSTQLRDLPVD